MDLHVFLKILSEMHEEWELGNEMTSDEEYLDNLWNDAAIEAEKQRRTEQLIILMPMYLKLLAEARAGLARLKLNSYHISDASLKNALERTDTEMNILQNTIERFLEK